MDFLDITALKLAAAAFKSALQAQDRQAVIAAAERLIELDAPLGQQWQGLAQEVFRWGELNLALRALDTWASQGSAGPFAGYQKAAMLARVGKAAEAASEMATLPPDAPTPVANAYLQGALATNLGKEREAERHFRRALKAAPESGRSWLGLVQLGPIGRADETAMRDAAPAIRRAPVEDRAAYAIALGMLEHAAGHYPEAFAHYREANEIERERYTYDAADNEASAAIAGSWTAGEIAEFAAMVPAPVRRPLFVTGLARSGTTLVEQILASHSSVDAGGELGLALQLEAIVGGFAPADFHAYLAGNGSLASLQGTFLRLVAERVAGAGPFVDKTLNMSRALGPLSALFPDSPIVWMRRDPVENALSIYRTWLANNVVGGWRLEELADHMRLENRLLEHWRHELGDRLLVVQYEELVEDPRGWTERITRHCGLEVEPRQFESHRSERAVTTASALQVRQPINRRGIGAAEPYRAFLKPFIDACGA
jgi:tetratricopeptide (TPR) repeat protein